MKKSNILLASLAVVAALGFGGYALLNKPSTLPVTAPSAPSSVAPSSVAPSSVAPSSISEDNESEEDAGVSQNTKSGTFDETAPDLDEGTDKNGQGEIPELSDDMGKALGGGGKDATAPPNCRDENGNLQKGQVGDIDPNHPAHPDAPVKSYGCLGFIEAGSVKLEPIRTEGEWNYYKLKNGEEKEMRTGYYLYEQPDGSLVSIDPNYEYKEPVYNGIQLGVDDD